MGKELGAPLLPRRRRSAAQMPFRFTDTIAARNRLGMTLVPFDKEDKPFPNSESVSNRNRNILPACDPPPHAADNLHTFDNRRQAAYKLNL